MLESTWYSTLQGLGKILDFSFSAFRDGAIQRSSQVVANHMVMRTEADWSRYSEGEIRCLETCSKSPTAHCDDKNDRRPEISWAAHSRIGRCCLDGERRICAYVASPSRNRIQE